MPNPFTYYARPANSKEAQSTANWATYERMGASEDLRGFDAMRLKAPADVIANNHTMRWVERELIHAAQVMRAKERAA